MSAVHTLWGGVMDEVGAVSKAQRNQSQNFNFRGIDDVVNAVSPALRKAGVFIVPTATDIVESRDVATRNGGTMRNLTIRVTWTVYGPDGDSFVGSSLGESSDSGDKATPKAHSVAYRTFLLQSLCIPTDDVDPDQHVYERASAPQSAPRGGQGDQAQAALDGLLTAIKGAADMDALVRIREQADARGALTWAGVSAALDARKAALQS